MTPILELRTSARATASFVAVDGVSLAVPAGSIFGLLGPNGAGKTTTIRMIMDITAPDSGEILLFGQPRDGRGPAADRLPARGARPLPQDDGDGPARLPRRDPRPQAARAGARHRSAGWSGSSSAGAAQVQDRGAVEGHAAEGAAHRHRAPQARPADPRRAVLRPRSAQPGAVPRPAPRLPAAGQERHPLHPRHGARRADVRPHLPDLPGPRHPHRRAAARSSAGWAATAYPPGGRQATSSRAPGDARGRAGGGRRTASPSCSCARRPTAPTCCGSIVGFLRVHEFRSEEPELEQIFLKAVRDAA